MSHHRCAAALFALLAAQGARAQDVSTEVGSATVWFALLVVLFALLVSVGLFVGREHDEAPGPEADAQPSPPLALGLRASRVRPANTHPKRQEFS